MLHPSSHLETRTLNGGWEATFEPYVEPSAATGKFFPLLGSAGEYQYA